MTLSDIHTIKSLLAQNNLWAKKFLGQNFLINPSTLEKILETAEIKPEETIIEIGPGFGVLTEKLVQKAQNIISIELDHSLAELLKANFENHKNLQILHQDGLKFTPPNTPYKIVANIPYNITSPLINHFLQSKNPPTSMTILVQKEVAQKICTLEPDMSILSLQIALFGQAKFIKKVPAGHFHPSPRVDSAILKIEIYQPENPKFIPHDNAIKALNLAKKAFSQKRKKLSTTLPELKQTMQNAGIDPNRRPETLSVKEWLKIS